MSVAAPNWLAIPPDVKQFVRRDRYAINAPRIVLGFHLVPLSFFPLIHHRLKARLLPKTYYIVRSCLAHPTATFLVVVLLSNPIVYPYGSRKAGFEYKFLKIVSHSFGTGIDYLVAVFLVYVSVALGICIQVQPDLIG